LLPGVNEVIEFSCPWILGDPPAVDPKEIGDLVARLRALEIDDAVVLTSFHQSALPTALLLRLAGVARICAASVDYPGSLLDVRIEEPGERPEPERMVEIAAAAGYPSAPDDDGRLALRSDLPRPPAELRSRPFVVVHPGAGASSRRYPIPLWKEVIRLLLAQGETVALTGSDRDGELSTVLGLYADGGTAAPVNLVGKLDLAQLAGVLAEADVLVAGNTGPAHLAAAVGTPVVSLFSPVVSARRWAPYGIPVAVLGDAQAPCRDTRARRCPVPGHPCLSSIQPADVVRAVRRLGVAVADPPELLAAGETR
jgi:ADP-heptose:LPS heptosyltransferase